MSGNHSPRHSLDSHQSRRASRSPASSSWNNVVRGESEPVAAVSSSPPPVETSLSVDVPVSDTSSVAESSDNGGERNGSTGKRPVWNKNADNGGTSEVRPVIDAHSWPALSESARATMKSESSKGLLDGSSVSQSQGMESTPSSSQRQVSDNATVDNTAPAPQNPIKYNSSNASSSNGGHPQQPAPQVSAAATGSHNSSSRDHTQRRGFVSNGHPQQRNSFRNRNGGPHQRGDGAHHNNYGNRRDQDWNTRQNFNGRDMHMPSRVAPRVMRPPPPPNSAQFIHPPPLQPFRGHIGFHELAPPLVFVAAPPPPSDSLRGVPFVPPMPHHAMYFAGPDPQLNAKIVSQIEYYFSNENLVKDTFLRQNMDDQGWVQLKLISGFNKVMQLTENRQNTQLILDAVKTSSFVEVQGDKIRRRNDWERWIMPRVHGVLNHEVLAEQVNNIALETTNYDSAGGLDVLPENSLQNPAFRDLNSPFQLSTTERAGQLGVRGSDISTS